MANGVPVRLSEALATRARSVAAVQDRSLTEQVEHWARLGQVVEAAVSSTTMLKLKARSYDAGLDEALDFADSAEGRAAAAALILGDNDVRYEETSGNIHAVTREGKRTKVGKTTPIAAIHEGSAKGAAPRRTANKTSRTKLRAVADSRVSVKIPRRRSKLAKGR